MARWSGLKTRAYEWAVHVHLADEGVSFPFVVSPVEPLLGLRLVFAASMTFAGPSRPHDERLSKAYRTVFDVSAQRTYPR